MFLIIMQSLFGFSIIGSLKFKFHFSKSLCIINLIDIILFPSLLTICKTVLIRSNVLQTRFIISLGTGNRVPDLLIHSEYGIF